MSIKEDFHKIINSLSSTHKEGLKSEIDRILDNIEITSKPELNNQQNDKSQLDFKKFQINQIIDAAPAAISFIDLEYTYVFTNQGYKNWFGRNLDGYKVYDFVGIEHFNKNGKVNLSRAFKGELIHKELEFITNGQKFQLMVTYAPAQNINKKIIGAYVYCVDISHLNEIRKALQEKNKELQLYIDSYLQLENFAHIASHDLKAPLKNVISFGELLHKNAGSKLTTQENKFLEFIQSSAHNMEKTIKGLLDFSLLSNQKPEFKQVSPQEILDSLIADLRTVIEQKKAKIHVGTLSNKIIVDPILFKQLLQNLILNAIKFCDKDHPVVEITTEETDEHFWFYIKDNGIGIKNKHLQKIFAVFTRLNGVEEYEGTGIGLALAKKITTHHKGEIRVKSAEGKGSTFYFSIHKELKESAKPIVSY